MGCLQVSIHICLLRQLSASNSTNFSCHNTNSPFMALIRLLRHTPPSTTVAFYSLRHPNSLPRHKSASYDKHICLLWHISTSYVTNSLFKAYPPATVYTRLPRHPNSPSAIQILLIWQNYSPSTEYIRLHGKQFDFHSTLFTFYGTSPPLMAHIRIPWQIFVFFGKPSTSNGTK